MTNTQKTYTNIIYNGWDLLKTVYDMYTKPNKTNTTHTSNCKYNINVNKYIIFFSAVGQLILNLSEMRHECNTA